MDEHELRRGLAEAASRGIPEGTHLATDVVARAATSRRRKPWWQARLRIALVGAVVVASLTTAGAVAVANGTFPVQFNLIQGREQNDAGPGAADKKRAEVAASMSAADEAKRQALAADKKTATESADAGQRPEKQGDPEAKTVTLAEAEAAFGAHVLVPPAASDNLIGVQFLDASAFGTKPGAPDPRDSVTLKYSLGGSTVIVTEERDPSPAALTVDALSLDSGPAMKTEGGLGPAAIESIDGGSYVVGRSVDGSSVVWIIWKSSNGVVVTIHFQPGVAHEAALEFALSFE
jgi:hypothetical protein